MPSHTLSHRFSVIRQLGKGTFGKVFLVTDAVSGATRALKRTQKWRKKESREVLCLEIGKESPNLISAEEVFYSYTPSGFMVQNILMENAGYTLHRYVASHLALRQKDQTHNIEASTAISIAKQVCNGLFALHRRAVAHRDLKPENVLIKDYGGQILARICDFGSSKTLTNQGCPSMPYICSRWYRAPELLLGSTNYTVAVDLWSLGCVLAELILLRPLLECEPHNQKHGMQEQKPIRCLGEPFQILKISELLGAPTRVDTESLCTGCPERAKALASSIFKQMVGLAPLPLHDLLLSVIGIEGKPLVDVVCQLLRWNPRERIPVKTILDGHYLD
ncbi:putative cell-cycle-associated protein kinase GSK [Toxoplasma gondii RUB]|uniref:Cell-cycle-associated protein kinase GSK n=11 Tax=Toxoplasma gondii TaxID=5811 RepID=A0A125YUD6_TOXGV|nr:putative cell-cycle-associated protein kinase GSK [Toxoplasma gondii GT1]ESS33513.1 putative cell-cycle-associated protein kinase GSK [Toxoplasma gondii VEG]KAF4644112.1 putative cell-cycle-associated protein kinase GSK [Toxoplasma gondii]KFG28142.1 putative cell-cycle-associated protein kinase GSK [Toxoplasma gondii p89]KFG38746.1 putative cell-cycle-associated protein kinase GSK [Toxoplasma gondii GAB2-2007-GAL-DOM2]KFG43173.1 putative cell-cycle-associated protein kinase GSK [Toxoplasma 